MEHIGAIRREMLVAAGRSKVPPAVNAGKDQLVTMSPPPRTAGAHLGALGVG